MMVLIPAKVTQYRLGGIHLRANSNRPTRRNCQQEGSGMINNNAAMPIAQHSKNETRYVARFIIALLGALILVGRDR